MCALSENPKSQGFLAQKIRAWQRHHFLHFRRFFELPFLLSALNKMYNSAILTFNQCPQTCYKRASLVNWITELMLKYYGSVFFLFVFFFLFLIQEEIHLHKWLSPQDLPLIQCSTFEPDEVTKQSKYEEKRRLEAQTWLSWLQKEELWTDKEIGLE